MVERRLPARFSLFRILAGFKSVDESCGMNVKIEKSANNKDDDFIPSNTNSKVLIEYYKHLGRGPM